MRLFKGLLRIQADFLGSAQNQRADCVMRKVTSQ